jgi:hypothetical protein
VKFNEKGWKEKEKLYDCAFCACMQGVDYFVVDFFAYWLCDLVLEITLLVAS